MKMGECLLIPGDDVVEVVPPGILALFIPWARDKIYLKDGTCHKANYYALIWNECGVPDVLLGYSARYLETPERLRMHTHTTFVRYTASTEQYGVQRHHPTRSLTQPWIQ